jgi:hypothetical protein
MYQHAPTTCDFHDHQYFSYKKRDLKGKVM